MDELEEKINAVLNNPAELEKLSKIAASVMGGGEPGTPAAAPEAQEPDAGLLRGMVEQLRGGGKSSESRRLLEAMKPFLTEKRRRKVDRAMRLARLASLAELAADKIGGDEDV